MRESEAGAGNMNVVVGFENSSLGGRLDELNAGWRNVLIDTLGLRSRNFQLAQGTLGMRCDQSGALCEFADQIPGRSSILTFDGRSRGGWSESYGRLLAALSLETESGLQGYLRDDYPFWIAWRNLDYRNMGRALQFERWAAQHLDPTRARIATEIFRESLFDATHRAGADFTNPGNWLIGVTPKGDLRRVPRYTGNAAAAAAALYRDRPVEIAFDSDRLRSDMGNTVFTNGQSRVHRMFAGAVRGAFDDLEQRAAASRMTITGRIGAYGVMPTNPGGWYDDEVVRRAQSSELDDTVWDAASNAGRWDSFFGPRSGSLRSRITGLLLVSDYAVTVTSHAFYTEAEAARIALMSRAGIWPFFANSGAPTHRQHLTRNADGSVSVTLAHSTEGCQIWGANVQDLSE